MKAARSTYDLALFGAWQGERFARIDRLKSVGHYLKALNKTTSGPETSGRQTPAEMLLAFQAIAARGGGVKIEEVA